MALSKSTRMTILLAIDTAFFLLEIVTGYAVHSLALVADAFHMLNDVLSLLVGLWAVKISTQKKDPERFTYGWQRAETIGALINGVFLVALCLSIFLEAIQRFVEPQEISNPKIILIVGCCGLASNILGLFLFHDHGHDHGAGGHGHAHGEEGDLASAEEGIGNIAGKDSETVADQRGNIADVLPQNRIAGWAKTNNSSEISNRTRAITIDESTPLSPSNRSSATGRNRRSSSTRGYSTLGDDIPVHPNSFRRSFIARASEDPTVVGDEEFEEDDTIAEDIHEDAPLIAQQKSNGSTSSKGHRKSRSRSSARKISHQNHAHTQPETAGGHGGHSHGDLNMRGVFLHVLGDALGNIGVIASALFIWLTPFTWRFYTDPAISLVITIIILLSAIPLCKAASRILLQAVPEHLSIDDIKSDIEKLDGILSCHHLHVWELKNATFVASLHVRVGFDFDDREGAKKYMDLVREVDNCLHGHGIQNSTIQPEFCTEPSHDHTGTSSGDETDPDAASGSATKGSKTTSLCETSKVCLLECGDSCDSGKKCCDRKSDRH
ncbi:MAG: hypothetical protein M1820_010511 [Bogoriella megaspora]|nr:MAG: hypothetical protein M1820_010511 [Bogoriella megaspora]